MNAEVAVAVRNLRFAYQVHEDSQFDLSIDSLNISSGRVTVLAGENGSGKTTLLKIIAGLISSYQGLVELEIGDDQRCVLVHQNPYLLGGSVHRNVSYGLRIKKTPEPVVRRAVENSLKRVGLSGYEKKRISSLSGGERRRVSLARALAVGSTLLLLDEPTTSVDKKNIELLVDLAKDLTCSGTTVVVTSHDMPFAYRICDEMLLLDHGRITLTEQNILKGNIRRTDDSFIYFGTGNGMIRCPAQDGDFSTAVIPIADVILSPGAVETSAQNQIPGVVTDIEKTGNRYRVTIDCGFPVSSYVTGYSIEHLHVTIGMQIYVIFKASAIKLY